MEAKSQILFIFWAPQGERDLSVKMDGGLLVD